MEYKPIVEPRLDLNLFLDHTLKLQRGPDGVEFQPKDCHCSGDGYVHFSIVTAIGEEAAWQSLGHDHAVPCNVVVSLFRPARVDAGLIIGIGRPLRNGHNVFVAEGTVCQDGHMICKVMATFVHFIKREVAERKAA